MSEVFTFTPGGVETIDAFNARLAPFCGEGDIVDVFPSCGGSTLVLSLTEPEDIPFPMPFAYQPYVMLAHEADMLTLEKTLGEVSKKLIKNVAAANDVGEDEIIITRTQLISLPAEPKASYILMLVVIGTIDTEAE